MIVRIFKSGVSNGESPVRYLLGNLDHTGSERAVEPEVLEGNPQTTIDVINSIQRKYKYISGCISFRDSERPTKAQLYDLIDDFKQTFCPGLTSNNFNSLFVLHQDKGNTEVHFVFPSQILADSVHGGGRRFNIHPPGKQNILFFESFVKVTNQKLGYVQVVPDPLKIAFTDFERKTSEGRKDKSNKRWIQRSVIKAVTNGEIKNRADLCRHLDEKLGITITRQGKDYLSVKLPGALKAKRLRGALYSEDADYQGLITQSMASKQPYYLSPTEFKAEQIKLNDFIYAREQFNIKAYLTPRPSRRFAKQVNPLLTITTRRNYMNRIDYLPIIKGMIMEALKVAKQQQIPETPTTTIFTKAKTTTNLTSIRNKGLGVDLPNGDFRELKMTIAEIQQNMMDAIGEMNRTKNPAQAARIQQRVIQLKIQLAKLNKALHLAKIAESQKLIKGFNSLP
ncbi:MULTISPECIES: relaxase/mobilization nuclease domain-containing protein [unclassified Methylophilus]|uniref:relaxase/mobilization nuclease domain-containing protein n=1 Tax=unclassified Methylophilus TaxID=2630143 RepID=UPI0003648377|nr:MULTISPECIES: relaxase/mobilization nuclease domain-containing protein [unclassified Methylophilus]